MAKYIDLLRAHQHQSPSNPQALTPVEEHEELAEFNKNFDDPMLTDETGHEAVQEHIPQPHTIETVEPEQTLATPPTPTQYADEDWLMTCAEHVLHIFQQAQQNTTTSIHALSQSLNEILPLLEQTGFIDKLELNIARKTRDISAMDADLGSLIQKSMMMMLYAIKAGQRLKLNPDELRAHTLAGMLHHIGMAQVSSDIRHKKERLSKDEITEIRQSPQKGHDFLEKCGITDICILQASAQSTERYDGSGSTGLSGSDIAWSARLIGVLSMFEALIHYRPYRQRLLPRDAIREMVKNHKPSFDPNMLKALIESISLYPIGTFVKLNTDEVGLVIRIHPRLPLRPVVDISMDGHGNAVPPRQVDLQTQPNLIVEQCMYEEALSSLGNDKS